MATWVDGPEYAPAARPDAFAAPVAAPLSVPSPVISPSAGAPVEPPGAFEPPRDAVRPLTELIPPRGPERDPKLAYQVVATVMTEGSMSAGGSAWNSAHSSQSATGGGWTPDQAFITGDAPPDAAQGFPAPGSPAWFGPGQPYDQSQPRVPLTANSVLQGVTWGVVITLVLGGVIQMLAPVLLVISFALTSQVHYRRRHVRIGFVIAFAVTALAGLYSAVADGSLDAAWSSMGTASMIFSWILLVVALGLQYVAIRDGEQPDS